MLSSFFSCLLTLIESLYEILKNIATFLFSSKEVIEFPSAGYKVEIENKIADGGFSVVYLVSDKSRTNGGQRYAMKRVICGDGEMEDGCQKEIQVHRSCNHPNLMPLVASKFDTFSSPIKCYMLFPVMRYSLRDEITKRGILSDDLPNEMAYPFSESEILGTFGQIIDGLKVLHQVGGYAHYDLKPENILFDTLGKPVIMDFGSAQKLHLPISTRRQCLQISDYATQNSTMPYRAPELFEGELQPFSSDATSGDNMQENDYRYYLDGAKVDIWALGCVFFAMMYGSSPFEMEFSSASDLPRIVDCSHLRVLGEIPEPKTQKYHLEMMGFVKYLLQQNRAERPSLINVDLRLNELFQQRGLKRSGNSKRLSMEISSSNEKPHDFFV